MTTHFPSASGTPGNATTLSSLLSQTSLNSQNQFNNSNTSNHQQGNNNSTSNWRPTQRSRTTAAALLLCANIGVDPPDADKTKPTATKMCGIEPGNNGKAMEAIAKQLVKQYENWQPRARYKAGIDPTLEDFQRILQSSRKAAKEDRVLIHYNGHGVPRPTIPGELWVFNKTYTQYIPVSVRDILDWVGRPTLWVIDCHAAGNLVNALDRYDPLNNQHCIQLAACDANERLPADAALPLDLFTACLTTPLEVAALLFHLNSPLFPQQPKPPQIPGKMNDRKTPLGELIWIFNAITDTIAYRVLPGPLFRSIFRQDLLVAALFRNFLLAGRVMKSYGAHVRSEPPIDPAAFEHPLWDSWDLALDLCLSQLPPEPTEITIDNIDSIIDPPSPAPLPIPESYTPSDFFENHLRTFALYLKSAQLNIADLCAELPIVLQVLLSHHHRLEALILLAKFIDLGAEYVQMTLEVGIFPYIQKLLLSPSEELRGGLCFIWARVIAAEKSVAADLLTVHKEGDSTGGWQFFLRILHPDCQVSNDTFLKPDDIRLNALLVLTHVASSRGPAQCIMLKSNVITVTSLLCTGPLRQWAYLLLGSLWKGVYEAKILAVNMKIISILQGSLTDSNPLIRASAISALSALVGGGWMECDTIVSKSTENDIVCSVLDNLDDANDLVRHEVLVLLSRHLIGDAEEGGVGCIDLIVKAAWDMINNEELEMSKKQPKILSNDHKITRSTDNISTIQSNASSDQAVPLNAIFLQSPPSPPSNHTKDNLYTSVWKTLLATCSDPVPDIASQAQSIVEHIHTRLLVIYPNLKLSLSPEFSPNRLTRSNSGVWQPARTQSLSRSSTSLSLVTIAGAALPSSKPLASSISNSLRDLLSSPATPKSTHSQSLRPTSSGSWRDLASGFASEKGLSTSRSVTSPLSRNDISMPLPLSSMILGRSTGLSLKPQCHIENKKDHADQSYYRVQWRAKNNDKLIHDTAKEYENAAKKRFDKQVVILESHADPISCLAFHAYMPHIVVTDVSGGIGVWNWESGKRLSQFVAPDEKAWRITCLRYIDEAEGGMIMTGTDDGIIRIYGDHYRDKPKLVTSWQALRPPVSFRKKPVRTGLVMSWNEKTSHVAVSGKSQFIRIWDIKSEMRVQDMWTRCYSDVTSLAQLHDFTADATDGSTKYAAGFRDGTVSIFDSRLAYNDNSVMSWSEHSGYVCWIHQQKGHCHQLVSGSSSGDVRFWDLRFQKRSVAVWTAHHNGGMTDLAVHDHAGILATGSDQKKVRVFDFQGNVLGNISKHEGLLGHKIGPVNALTFHPHRILLAVGSSAGIVTIYGNGSNDLHESSPSINATQGHAHPRGNSSFAL